MTKTETFHGTIQWLERYHNCMATVPVYTCVYFYSVPKIIADAYNLLYVFLDAAKLTSYDLATERSLK